MLVVPLGFIIFMETSIQSDACHDLGRQFYEISTYDCIWLVHENPGTTWQDVIDYYAIEKEKGAEKIENVLTTSLDA